MLAFAKRVLSCLAVVAALSLGWTAAASAQTIVQNAAGSNLGSTGLGQSFTATLTGTVTQIQVRPRLNSTTTVNFYNGTGSGITDNVGTPVSSQAVTLVDVGTDATGFQTIVLATPLPIVSGQTYSFAFGDGSALDQMSLTTTSVYAGGLAFRRFNESLPASDLAFTVTEVPPAPVPTMSEWMMILFGLVLAGAAVLAVQRGRLVL